MGAGEFGAFMRLGEPYEEKATALERRQQIAQRARLSLHADNADRAAMETSKLAQRLRKHETDAARIQEEISSLLRSSTQSAPSTAASVSSLTPSCLRDPSHMSLPPVVSPNQRMPPTTLKAHKLGAYSSQSNNSLWGPHRSRVI